MQTITHNVQEVLGGKFLPTPLVLSQDPSLLNPKDKSDKSKLCDFYKSSALQHLRPKGYDKCLALPYDLYCPSSLLDDGDYVCPCNECQTICTIKELLKFHLKATQHHSYGDTEIDVKSDEVVCDEQNMEIDFRLIVRKWKPV